MKNRFFKVVTAMACGLGISSIPFISTSCSCSNKQDPDIKNIIDLYVNRPEVQTITYSGTSSDPIERSLYFNDAVNKILTENKKIFWNQLYSEAFHFINIKGYSLNVDSKTNYQFLANDKTFIDLYNEGFVHMQVALSTDDYIKDYEQTVSGYTNPYHDIEFKAIFKVEYLRKYSFNDVTIPASTSLSYIFEFRESKFMDYTNLPTDPLSYYSNEWNWDLYFPSFWDNPSSRMFGVIETSICHGIFAIDSKYMHTNDIYQQFKLNI